MKAPNFSGVVPALGNTSAAFLPRHLVAIGHVMPWTRLPKEPQVLSG